MKSHTDIEQSQKLAEILPLESADMCWTNHYYGTIRSSMRVSSKTIKEYKELLAHFADNRSIDVFYPCWSLAALLDILPNYQMHTQDDGTGILCSYNGKFNIITADNPVDVCYELILKLHEPKMT